MSVLDMEPCLLSTTVLPRSPFDLYKDKGPRPRPTFCVCTFLHVMLASDDLLCFWCVRACVCVRVCVCACVSLLKSLVRLNSSSLNLVLLMASNNKPIVLKALKRCRFGFCVLLCNVFLILHISGTSALRSPKREAG